MLRQVEIISLTKTKKVLFFFDYRCGAPRELRAQHFHTFQLFLSGNSLLRFSMKGIDSIGEGLFTSSKSCEHTLGRLLQYHSFGSSLDSKDRGSHGTKHIEEIKRYFTKRLHT